MELVGVAANRSAFWRGHRKRGGCHNDGWATSFDVLLAPAGFNGDGQCNTPNQW